MSVRSSADEITAVRARSLSKQVFSSRRTWIAFAYSTAFTAFFLLCLLMSRTVVVTSDASNNALQGWDLLHGHLLLHGWIIGDATYYGYELPLYALTEAAFGLTDFAAHVEAALSYTIIAILASAIAKHRRTGFDGAVRVGVVLAILCASMTTGSQSAAGTTGELYGPVLLLGEPNHTSTCVFLLGTILLLQRKPDWRGTPWILFALLTIGQVGDLTVRYIFVSAVVLVCAWRTIRSREWKSQDAICGIAALLSAPASLLVRKAMLALGSYTMVSPPTQIAQPRVWPTHLRFTIEQIPQLFGVVDLSQDLHGTTTLKLVEIICMPLGVAALVLISIAIVRTAFSWLRADRTDQLLLLGIITYIGAYAVSTVIGADRLHEFSGVMPVMAVLAARNLPTRLAVSRAAVPIAVLAALIPLVAGVSARPVPPAPAAVLASWLEAHNLHYGVSGYWEASAVTVASGDAVQVRAVANLADLGLGLSPYEWEIQSSWFDPDAHDATFVISNYQDPGSWFDMNPIDVEAAIGMPKSIVEVDSYDIMIYPFNILDRLPPVTPVPHSE